MFAHNYLEHAERLADPKLNLPISFFYGDIDWMDEKSGRRVVSNNYYKDTLSHVHIVSESDHHMYLDNPDEFVALIFKDLDLTRDNWHCKED